jgi:ATPase subunit of ABC transporter with duplicated ATPase domains
MYDQYATELKKHENKLEDISLGVTVCFDEPRFNSEVIDQFLNKADVKQTLSSEWRDGYEYRYKAETHQQSIAAMFAGLLSGKVRTVKNRSAKEAAHELLQNRYFLDFQLVYKGDPLEKMSPGKKGLVLLKLLIALSQEEWPVLLDQPDDDLDSRSVYTDLVSFIRARKARRQIIVVTHDPNLVVGADAELVTVANQDGQETGRENRKFHFEYVTGSLEHSFECPEAREPAILYRKGIREHVCEILEGGEKAFREREQKYAFHTETEKVEAPAAPEVPAFLS